MGYDQWKTASPYDDEPDEIEEARRFLKQFGDGGAPVAFDARDILWAAEIIKRLLDTLEEEGIT